MADLEPKSGSLLDDAATWLSGRTLPQRRFYNETRSGLFNTATPPDEAYPYGGLGRSLKEKRTSNMYEASEISDAVPRLPDYVKPGDHEYNTDLGKDQELKFQDWLKQNNIPFDAAAPVSDYDMRGFYKALQSGDPKAKEALNANDNQMHFPDYWKTPYHKSFSAESQWADPKKAPQWNDQDQLVMPDGRVVYDEKKEALERTFKKQEDNKKQLELLKKVIEHPQFGAAMQGSSR